MANQTRLQELEKKLNEEDGNVSSLNRRLMLIEVRWLITALDLTMSLGWFVCPDEFQS